MGSVIDIGRVARIIEEVGRVEILPRWRNLAAGDILSKSKPTDIVTVADRAAEAVLSERLSDVLPGSVVVGEESVHADPGRLAHFGGHAPIWVIDPIDGTSAFAAGKPDFTVMVALIVGGEPVAGWIHAPTERTTCLGEVGGGAYFSGPAGSRRLAATTVADLRAPLVGIVGRKTLSKETQATIQAQGAPFGRLRPAVYAGHEYSRLVMGEAQFALFNRSEPWDHLPGVALTRALGFSAVKRDGSPYRPGDNRGGLLIAPLSISAELLARFAPYWSEPTS